MRRSAAADTMHLCTWTHGWREPGLRSGMHFVQRDEAVTHAANAADQVQAGRLPGRLPAGQRTMLSKMTQRKVSNTQTRHIHHVACWAT